ncbi:MAG: NlpC/P60 family protein [Bacteroidales bacterium]|uniref:C40 family peptidase n=1 Tax=Porphyromonas sp. TaxID=1924944 RepID=UPI0029717338|nr:NlpC/P60 family protein [Porphyromonas sp.]MDD7438358.1 NlpC/P60 family protein [Bacteroidales bacterium]MDY3067794.1 NlpC/P60 family protein [Porphyromonas sp.]
MIENHHIRRIWLVVLLILMMGSTSCRTIKQPAKRVLIPGEVITNEDPIINAEEIQLAEKLSTILRIEIETPRDNLHLYSFVDDWIGTRYRFGGTTKKGTDCSGFVYRLYQDVYNTDVGRQSSADLMNKTKRIKKIDLREGDLVFFNINNRRGGRASHVGVYLKDNKFIHASTRRGVIISDLNEPYYERTYLGAGRVEE